MLDRMVKLLGLGPGFKREPDGLYVFDMGNTVPTDATAGYAEGCPFLHLDGAVGTQLYINEGSSTSCDFNPVSGLTAAQEALLGATAGTATASKALILDANSELTSGAIQIQDGMTPGTGISTGTGTICDHRVTRLGDIIKTEILIDVTGLNSGGTANDIIGKDGTANCHIGQITDAVNGTIIAGRITCFETPATGDPDIDFYGSADEATGAEDAALSTLTGEEKLIDHGDWTAGDTAVLTALPDADGYMYMVCGDATDATYTAGIFLIEMWGQIV